MPIAHQPIPGFAGSSPQFSIVHGLQGDVLRLEIPLSPQTSMEFYHATSLRDALVTLVRILSGALNLSVTTAPTPASEPETELPLRKLRIQKKEKTE